MREGHALNVQFAYPWALWGLLLAAPAMFWHGIPEFQHSHVELLPPDPPSDRLRILLRGLAGVCVAMLALGASAPFVEGGTISKIGEGAEIVVVFDRSGSMTEPMLGGAVTLDDVNDAGGVGDRLADPGESKIAAARRVLLDFMRARRGDTFGLVVFNAAPIAVAPLSEDRGIAESALAAAQSRSTGYTALGRALGLGLEFFRGRERTAARVVLLVSDGGAVIRDEDGSRIKRMFAEEGASLIWIYARGEREPSVLDPPDKDVSESLQMHRFFSELPVGYKVFEVTSSAGLQQAVAEVGRLTSLPTRYEERLPRRDLAGPIYAAACACILLLLFARLHEVQSWVH
jgi:mxaC protein